MRKRLWWLERHKQHKPYHKRRQQQPAWSIADKLSIIGIIVAVVSSGLAQWNQVNNGRDTTNALRSLNTIATALYNQQSAITKQADATAVSAKATLDLAHTTSSVAEATRRSAMATEHGSLVAEADLRDRRSTDVDIERANHGLVDTGWTTTFIVKVVGAYALKNVVVKGFVGVIQPKDLPQIWRHLAPYRIFDMSNVSPYFFDFGVIRNSLSLAQVRSGYIAVTAVNLSFRDSNGQNKYRRGCVYYTEENLALSCDKN